MPQLYTQAEDQKSPFKMLQGIFDLCACYFVSNSPLTPNTTANTTNFRQKLKGYKSVPPN